MLTFFTTAKPFTGHSGIIQRNALQSWKLLHPSVEVILFGDDEGAAEACAELGLRHEPHVERHESGMKYLNFMFARAQQIAKHDFLCYSNCDIVMLKDFWKAFQKASAWRKRFLLIAQRWDTDVTEPIDFTNPAWAKDLRLLALTSGIRQHWGFVDYFVFPGGLYDQVPPLVVGRSYWDHWLVWKALSAGASVVDCSLFVVPVHQNHDYGYHPDGKKGTHEDDLALRNRFLCGDGKHLRCIPDSTHSLTKWGRFRWTPLRRQADWPSVQKAREHWQHLKNKTFWFRSRIGLRQETLAKFLGWKDESLD